MIKVPTFTLDTNCILAIDDSRPEASFVHELIEAHRLGNASVAIVAITASEKQKTGGYIENFAEFKDRITNLGLGHLDLLAPMFYFDITFFDYCLWCDESMTSLELSIHKILFPNIPFLWADYCTAHGLNVEADYHDKKWRNAKCDVQAYWSHVHSKRDVFVTTDNNYLKSKKANLIALSGSRIETPQSAAELLRRSRATGDPISFA